MTMMTHTMIGKIPPIKESLIKSRLREKSLEEEQENNETDGTELAIATFINGGNKLEKKNGEEAI